MWQKPLKPYTASSFGVFIHVCTCLCHPENGESGMIDALDDLIGLTTLYMILVGGLEHFSPYIGNSNPN